jgi:hypothetical protein
MLGDLTYNGRGIENSELSKQSRQLPLQREGIRFTVAATKISTWLSNDVLEGSR